MFVAVITLPARLLGGCAIPSFDIPEILCWSPPTPSFMTEMVLELSLGLPQHFLYFFPDPHGQGSFLLISFVIINSQKDYTTTMSTKSIIESSFRKALYNFDLIEDGKIAIALSGGKDSLTLLYLLHAVSGRGFPKFDLHAFHVQGTFSCGPAITSNFLQKMCDDMGVPLTLIDSSLADISKLECYSCSRQRRTLLFKHAKELGYTKIAFGHHLDDSVQTLLMNLFHKGEFAANLPKIHMHDYGITIIRPLLLVKESLILSFAQDQGFFRMTCQCPVGQNSMRKKVKELVNQIEELFPHVRTNLSHAGQTYGSDKALKK